MTLLSSVYLIDRASATVSASMLLDLKNYSAFHNQAFIRAKAFSYSSLEYCVRIFSSDAPREIANLTALIRSSERPSERPSKRPSERPSERPA